MNAIVEFKKDLRSLVERKELALPSSVRPEAFQNAAIVAVQDNPKILSCDKGSVFKAIRTLAAAGLVPDGREAALVPFKTKLNGNFVDVCQAMPMVFGLIKTARNSGEVKDIRAHIVYQNEYDQGRFRYVVGDEERIEHDPIIFEERGEPIGAYAIARLRDGSTIREFMTIADINKVRKAGASQKIYEKGAKPKVSDEPLGIWADWWEEMAKKTVIRRLCKRLPVSSEDARRIMADQDHEPIKDVTPETKGTPSFVEMAAKAREDAKAEDEPEVEEAEVVPDDADDDGLTDKQRAEMEQAEADFKGRDVPEGAML